MTHFRKKMLKELERRNYPELIYRDSETHVEEGFRYQPLMAYYRIAILAINLSVCISCSFAFAKGVTKEQKHSRAHEQQRLWLWSGSGAADQGKAESEADVRSARCSAGRRSHKLPCRGLKQWCTR